MAEFSISDAALTGFRVVREHPRAVLAWAAFQLVFSLLVQAVVLATASPELLAMMGDPSRVDPGRAAVFLGQLVRLAAVVLPLALIYYAIVLAAMNRIVLRPGDDRFGYLRLGGDEVRQLGLVVLGALVFFGIELVLTLAIGLIIGLLEGTRAIASSAILPLILVYAVMILFAVRFSLASALTFDRGRVDLFGSWALTRGRFWPLLGTLVLTLALALVIEALGFVIVRAVQMIAAGGDLRALMARPGAAASSSPFAPANLVAVMLNAVVTALLWPILLTPAPEIYRAIAGSGRAAAYS